MSEQQDEQFNVAVIVGSLRKASLSRKVAKALIALQPPSLNCAIVEIGDLPMYNEDLESNAPEGWTKFRGAIQEADAVLFVTPEYNRSVPGGLKNAMDVASRPSGANKFAHRPAGVVSVTPYNLGAFGSNHALRQTLVYLDMPVMQQPEAYVGNVDKLFDDAGTLTNKTSEKIFITFMKAFAEWVAKNADTATVRSFETFMKRRAEIASAYTNGDAAPIVGIATQNDPATFYSPGGDTERGATTIAARYERDAKTFSSGGTSRLEIHQSAASGNIGWWTGLQIADVKMKGKAESVPMTLRITETFRREDGEWKLVHRHADMAKPVS